MSAGNLQTIIATGLTIGLIGSGIAWVIANAVAKAEHDIDQAFGDWPHLTGEVVADREAHGGEGGIAAGHVQGLVALHPEDRK